jgi:5-methylcytosine-specific restriction endonuclease McrA
MQYKATIDFSYDFESEKDHNELLKCLEQDLNELTKGFVLNKRQIRLKKLREVKNKVRITVLEPEEFFKYVNKDNKTQEFIVDETVYTARTDSSRFFVFKKDSTCAACGIVGNKMVLELNHNDKSPHFNLYAEENGKLILMTKDHVKPKSKGGKNEIDNYQTMCAVCNNIKGNDERLTNEHIKKLRVIYNDNKNLPRKQFSQLLDSEKRKISNSVEVKKGKKEMKKTKGLERIERIKKESDKLAMLVSQIKDEAVAEQIVNLVKIIDEALKECNNEVSVHSKIEDQDSGRWNIVSITADGKCAGFVGLKNGKSTILPDIILATEFMSKKAAEELAVKLGHTYSVIGYPSKR